MISITAGTCIVGSELHGNSNKPCRPPKRNIAVLPQHNTLTYVLELSASCEIIKKSKLDKSSYQECLNIIRRVGYQPEEAIGHKIKGNEISCECCTQRSFQHNFVVFKGKIALAVLNKEFVSSGVYTERQVFVGHPEFQPK